MAPRWMAFGAIACVVALVGVAAAPARDANVQAHLSSWQIRSAKANFAPIYGGDRVRLVNQRSTRAVSYGAREYGINLVWSDPNGSNNITFRPMESLGRWLEFGDRVAVHVSSGGYLKYGAREYGINLVWSSTPVYEWRIYGVGRPGAGTAVRSGERVGLYNERSRKYVVYQSREYGINLGWMSGH